MIYKTLLDAMPILEENFWFFYHRDFPEGGRINDVWFRGYDNEEINQDVKLIFKFHEALAICISRQRPHITKIIIERSNKFIDLPFKRVHEIVDKCRMEQNKSLMGKYTNYSLTDEDLCMINLLGFDDTQVMLRNNLGDEPYSRLKIIFSCNKNLVGIVPGDFDTERCLLVRCKGCIVVNKDYKRFLRVMRCARDEAYKLSRK